MDYLKLHLQSHLLFLRIKQEEKNNFFPGRKPILKVKTTTKKERERGRRYKYLTADEKEELKTKTDNAVISQDILAEWSFPSDSDSKESAHNAGDPGSVSGLGSSSGEGNGKPLQSSWLENSMDRGA